MSSVSVNRDTRWGADGAIWVVLLAVCFAVLPLQNTVLPRLISWAAIWSGWGWVLATILTAYYFRRGTWRRIREHRLVVGVAAGVTFLLFIASLAGAVQPLNVAALVRLLSVFWLCPMLVMLLQRRHTRELLWLGLLAVIVLHAEWAVLQFVFQHDFRLQLLGESHIAADVVGVAKFAIGGGKMIRAYGPYAHSNSLAGVMLVGMCLQWFLIRWSRWRQGWFHWVVLGWFVLALLLSFSRAGLAGLFLFGVACSILDFRLITRSVHFRRMLLFFLVLAGLFLPWLFLRTADPEDVAVGERLLGVHWAFELFHLFGRSGVGPGNYSVALEHYLLHGGFLFHEWQVAPVHDVPLLILIEFGVGPSVLFLLLLAIGLWRMGRYAWLLAVFIPPLLLDHYFYSQLAPSGLLLVVIVSLLMCHTFASE